VIVQDLTNREREILRVLSDEQGNVPTLDVPAGLYRVIATAPYGLFQTSVREFLVGREATQVVVTAQTMPTHGYGDVVTAGTARVQVQVIGSDGQPATGAHILIRDRDATLHTERWYTADEKGMATIELVSEPTVVVVVYSGEPVATEFTEHDLSPVIRFPKH
jgi:hypothetical protein